ncbi:MAG TPA: response regulator [Kofleriaceae bacterium]|jgi:CheY-like chemotaxis protein
MKILVVDDDPGMARAVQRLLRGDEVEVAHAPDAALDLVESADKSGRPFELVLCDYLLPGMTGIELGTALSERREPPMFGLMSGYDSPAALTPNLVALVKPFTPTELRQAVRALVTAKAAAITQRIPRLSLAVG